MIVLILIILFQLSFQQLCKKEEFSTMSNPLAPIDLQLMVYPISLTNTNNTNNK